MKGRRGPQGDGLASRASVAVLARVAVLAGVAGLAGIAVVAAPTGLARALFEPADTFDHAEHAGVFPACVTCHEGTTAPGAAMYPGTRACATCHDGSALETVDWSPPSEPPATNLAFDHESHADALAADGTEAGCASCHSPDGADWMAEIRLADAPQCVACHELGDHLETEGEACIVCHVPLPRATRIDESRIASFPAPSSHADGFAAGVLHGPDAGDPSCAVCHARDFCAQCHVNAPEEPSIQDLGEDPRAVAIPAVLTAPDDHASESFLRAHGDAASEPACLVCHTQPSCTTCHVATPEVAADLHPPGPGRADGAATERRPPPDHDAFYRFDHGAIAAASTQTCAGCHSQEQCLECHRPDAGEGPAGFHPIDWLSRHPAGAYGRETSCTDCHNPTGFCASCHKNAGLVAQRDDLLGAGFHDGQGSFVIGHGQAARQSLESCVSCHAERDCTSCHSATRGRGFNPHGPDFDADRLRSAAPAMCAACHRDP